LFFQLDWRGLDGGASLKWVFRSINADIALDSTDMERRPVTGLVSTVMNLDIVKNENMMTIRTNVSFQQGP
jgi:hypothetical protein